ncbi:helix-turn-helix transcriptional regulator [Parvibaculum sp.]|jgi:phage repressor protein C with HTH and peptisase S24 domain|uniref:helix-turn-helix transcriptional regulator n=1 Tax=Parvibaculum sp. TaxID=2024848 RepID=UPI001B1843DC|nr:helix-turn-helix transcriptional regulator [Parvibaculum sp.]MBO6635134.1 helix-turn-helix transcriptional regulator [Parvibaculum sp.]MBO6678095.1 helix-turn-helix transcriptional regulator [Parvibaculum sp.]MBO6684595.1 helix-turn-helix transcriptional regulator [Parvibaculum sp.]MBO6906056.1 helix-turn-helix transcriptional regulator [Parvibaculum sp.]
MPRPLSHARIWAAIDALAARHGMSVSGLAKAAGLDPTTFNKSKRVTAAGRPRWPNTESLSRILQATGADPEDLLLPEGGAARVRNRVPLIGLAQAGSGGYFDDAGFPVGGGWEETAFPDIKDEHAYALEVTGDSMEPFYREGDIIVVSPAAEVRRGDRVVVKTIAGEVMAKVLARQTQTRVELHSFNPAHEDRVLKPQDILWMARIVWASQ